MTTTTTTKCGTAVLIISQLILGSGVRSFGERSATTAYDDRRSEVRRDAGPDAEVQKEYQSEMRCLRRLDEVLRARWLEEIATIRTSDLRDVPRLRWRLRDSSFAKYSTIREEWLMSESEPTRRVDECFRTLVSDVVPRLGPEDVDCLNEVYENHMREETIHRRAFHDFLNRTAAEQTVFRPFASFPDVAEIIFQNRNVDAMTDLERILFEHAFSYLSTDEDRLERTYVTTLECEWRNARKLREAPGAEARFREFADQVRSTASKQVAAMLLKKWNLSVTLNAEQYRRWLVTREKLEATIKAEIAKFRKRKKDAQWLCERATRLAYESSDEQLADLLGNEEDEAEAAAAAESKFEIQDVAARARSLEEAIGRLPPNATDDDDDEEEERYRAVSDLADRYERETMCVSAFVRLVQNHRRYEIVSMFVDGSYTYPEMFCRVEDKNFGLIQVTFCNCIGSICGVAHPLAAVFNEEYALVQGPDGTFRTTRTGTTSKRKITHCHTLANPTPGSKVRRN